MAYVVFNIAVTLAYLAGNVVLVRELRTSTAEERKEKQTFPLIIAATVLYVVVIWKTDQLAQMFGL